MEKDEIPERGPIHGPLLDRLKARIVKFPNDWKRLMVWMRPILLESIHREISDDQLVEEALQQTWRRIFGVVDSSYQLDNLEHAFLCSQVSWAIESVQAKFDKVRENAESSDRQRNTYDDLSIEQISKQLAEAQEDDDPIQNPISGDLLMRLKARLHAFPGDWHRLIVQMSPRLFSFIRKKLWDEQVAEDALQETWQLIFGKVDPSYANDALQRAYLFWQALAAIKSVRKKSGHIREHVGCDDETGVTDFLLVQASVNNTTEIQELGKLLEVMQEDLNELQRKVLRLRFCEGRSFRKITEELKEPQGTICSAYSRAIAKLRKKIGDGKDLADYLG